MFNVHVLNGVVDGLSSFAEGIVTTHGKGGQTYLVADGVDVQIGYGCAADPSGNPTFTAPPPNYTPRIVSIGTFLTSIGSEERAALRSHTDPLIKEFVAFFSDPRITEIDLNQPAIQFDVRYAAGLVPAKAGKPIENPPIAGEERAAQILGESHP